MLSDRRLSLQHQTMEDLLLLKTNKGHFQGPSLEELLNNSVDTFLQKRRKRKLAEPAEEDETPKKKQREESQEEEEEEEESEVQ